MQNEDNDNDEKSLANIGRECGQPFPIIDQSKRMAYDTAAKKVWTNGMSEQ